MTADTEHHDETEAEKDEKPRGTLFIMICFLVMLILMWSWVYFEMIAG